MSRIAIFVAEALRGVIRQIRIHRGRDPRIFPRIRCLAFPRLSAHLVQFYAA
jgi:hypothetical protein